MSPLMIALIVVVLLGLGALAWFTRPVITCPSCKSKDAKEINREALGARFYESYPGGTPAGGRVETQMKYRVHFRCANCQHKWEKEITETR